MTELTKQRIKFGCAAALVIGFMVAGVRPDLLSEFAPSIAHGQDYQLHDKLPSVRYSWSLFYAAEGEKPKLLLDIKDFAANKSCRIFETRITTTCDLPVQHLSGTIKRLKFKYRNNDVELAYPVFGDRYGDLHYNIKIVSREVLKGSAIAEANASLMFRE